MFCTPIARILRAASASVSALRDPDTRNDLGLGFIRRNQVKTFEQLRRQRAAPGAGLSTVRLPRLAASAATYSIVVIGVSSCISTISQSSNAVSALATSSGSKFALALEATTIVFSARGCRQKSTPPPRRIMIVDEHENGYRCPPEPTAGGW